jgi:hypothetical protein
MIGPEEISEEQLDARLIALLQRDFAAENRDLAETRMMLVEAKREFADIKIEMKRGWQRNLETQKKKLLDIMVRFLILRRQAIQAELTDIQQEFKELEIEEGEEARLLRGR